MNITQDNYIQYKLIQKDTIALSYYFFEYDLSTLNKLLYVFYKEIKEIFNFYDKILKKNKVKLKLSKERNKIYLNFTNIINLDEEVDTNLELKEIKLEKEEIINILFKEVLCLKKEMRKENNEEKIYKEIKNEIKEIKEYVNNKIDVIINENQKKYNKLEKSLLSLENKINENEKNNEKRINVLHKKYEEEIKELKKKNDESKKNLKILIEEYEIKKEKEEKEKKEKEKLFELNTNDNVNLINDFKCENINNLKNVNNINNHSTSWAFKSIAVYNIERNKEIISEIAYDDENNNSYNIIIYNLSSNIIYNRINNAHSNKIYKIKHYYQSFTKNHILLTSSEDKSIKLWNISLSPISNILTINNCFDGDCQSPFCILFKNENYYILGGSRNQKMNIWKQNGTLIGPIEKSNLKMEDL